jgi:hypothetical protein
MTEEEFLARCKRLSHVAPAGAWESFQKNGLRTAELLILQADLDGSRQQDLLTRIRPDAVTLRLGTQEVTIRDQGPLLARKDLTSLLGDGMTVEEWVRILNKRVYLFVDPAARDKLMSKYVERDGAQDLIVFSPLGLWRTARGRLELSSQNTGAVARISTAYKFRETFLPVSRFPNRTPAEVTIADGLDDLSAVAEVMRVYSDGRRERLPV